VSPEGGVNPLIVDSELGTEGSLADLLDSSRQLIVEAQERGEYPTEIWISDDACRQAVFEARRRDIDRGMEPNLLGLKVSSVAPRG
jgi:hypothetical protein